MTQGVSPPEGFLLHGVIGRGASAVVWEATQVSTDRRVALKTFHADLRGADDRRRFDRERTLMAALSGHPHIVTLFDAGLHQDRPWLALQLYERGSYARHLAERGTLSAPEAVDVLIAVAEALAVAHARQIVHSDVKPGNIMRGDYDDPALGDFGVSRMLGGNTRTAAGGYSLDHVAPELLDEDDPTTACDVHSLATTVWELLCGRPPFRRPDDRSAARIMRRILTEPLPAPSAPDVPAELTRLLARMAAKDPGERPSAREVVAAARALRAPGTGPVEPPPAGPVEAPSAGTADIEPVTVEPTRLVEDTARTDDPLARTRRRARPVEGGAEEPHDEPDEGSDGWNDGWMDGWRDGGPDHPPPLVTLPRPVPRRRRRRRVLVVVAVLLLLAASGAVALLTAGPAPSTLLGAGEVGDGAFTPDFTSGTTLPGSALASSFPDGVGPGGDNVAGNTEALYRGEKGKAECDRDGLGRYLSDRPGPAAAWIQALADDPWIRWPGGPAPSTTSVAGYVSQLTPAILRADLAVTAHTFVAERTSPRSAVLQAGTVVLVDPWGVPRVRCRDGLPLGATTRPVTANSQGSPWPGYDPGAVVTIAAASRPVRQFGLVGLTGNAPFRRPAASTGGADIDQSPSTAALDGPGGNIFRLLGTQTSCNLTDCTDLSSYTLSISVDSCSATACRVSETDHTEWAGQLPLTSSGGTWTLSGQVTDEQGHQCGSEPKPTTIELHLRVTDAAVLDTLWTATKVEGDFGESSAETPGCNAGAVMWHFAGTFA